MQVDSIEMQNSCKLRTWFVTKKKFTLLLFAHGDRRGPKGLGPRIQGTPRNPGRYKELGEFRETLRDWRKLERSLEIQGISRNREKSEKLLDIHGEPREILRTEETSNGPRRSNKFQRVSRGSKRPYMPVIDQRCLKWRSHEKNLYTFSRK